MERLHGLLTMIFFSLISHNVAAKYSGQNIPTYTLTVNKTGSGQSLVSDKVGIMRCYQSSCTASGYTAGTYVLKAESYGPRFIGWSGACAASSSNPECTVTINSNTVVTANFEDNPTSPKTYGKKNVGNATTSAAAIAAAGTTAASVYKPTNTVACQYDHPEYNSCAVMAKSGFYGVLPSWTEGNPTVYVYVNPKNKAQVCKREFSSPCTLPNGVVETPRKSDIAN